MIRAKEVRASRQRIAADMDVSIQFEFLVRGWFSNGREPEWCRSGTGGNGNGDDAAWKVFLRSSVVLKFNFIISGRSCDIDSNNFVMCLRDFKNRSSGFRFEASRH